MAGEQAAKTEANTSLTVCGVHDLEILDRGVRDTATKVEDV
jgi:hypothetical protein